ncbi:MAG: class I SAM-dependent methyltransferase [Labedaea sp.]
MRVVTDHISAEDFEVRRCAGCDLVYISDAPIASELGRYYDNPAGAIMHRSPSALIVKARAVMMRREVKALAAFVPAGATILDFGAGDGSLARVLTAAGYDCYAADLYPEERWSVPGVPYHQYAPDLDVKGFLGDLPRLNAITMRHVLEHVLEPRALLAAFAEAEVDYVSLVVPNIESRLAKRLGSAWYYWDPPRHLTFFSPETLTTTANSAGFDVARLDLVGLDELATSAHRQLLLRAHRAPRPRPLEMKVAEVLRPTGIISSVSSAVSAGPGRATIKAVLRRR